MAAVEGVERLVAAEVALDEEALIEVGTIEVAILREVGIVEDTGAGPGVTRHTKGYYHVARPCTGTARF